MNHDPWFLNPYIQIGIIVLVIFSIVLVVLWIVLPFLIMGINKRLDKIIRQNDRLLDRLLPREETPEGLLERAAKLLNREKP